MHETFLLAALEQAQLGLGLCAPNPSVGAVAVQNGNIIARSYHKGAGTPHAEHLVLAKIPPKLLGITLYITLEPCNHWGRTPPCVDAIVQYGVQEVVFSYLDPNPLVAQNNSSAKLREKGIKVTHLPLEPISAFYQSYLYWTKTRRPRVTVKLAHSLDGRIGYTHGERHILSNAFCAEFTHEQRAKTDVILTTAKTVLSDNPKLNARIASQELAKPVAILDQNLNLNSNAQLFSTAAPCLIYHHSHKPVNYPNSHFYFMPLKNQLMDLDAIISHLGRLGYHDLWVEAGGALFSSLHQDHLVHKTYLYLVPTTLGEHAVPAYTKTGLFDRAHTISWNAMGDNMILCVDWQEDT